LEFGLHERVWSQKTTVEVIEHISDDRIDFRKVWRLGAAAILFANANEALGLE
jgi:hypothetical protein